MIWHSNTIADVLQELQVDPSVGLSTQEAAERLKDYGKNSLQEQRPLPFYQALAQQLRAPLTILLLIVAGIVLISNLFQQVLKEIPTDWEQALFVAVLAISGTLVGAALRCNTASTLSIMHNLSAPDARVRRDGIDSVCSAHELVPGDIVILKTGDIVPADCRLIEAYGLRCDDGSLTGTTTPVIKDATAIYDNITPLAQRANMLYAGTIVTAGTATAVVVATGVYSEMGRARHVSDSAPNRSKKTQTITSWWSLASIAIGILAIIVGLVQHANRSAVFLTAVALVMAMVPQNIDDVLTLLSARTAGKMAQHRVRLYHPEVIESLGQVTVFCAEQETLIEGRDVHLNSAFVGHQHVNLTEKAPKAPGLGQLLRLATLNAIGTAPMDSAILECANRLGIDRSDLLMDMPRIGELSDSSMHKTGVHLAGDQTLILVGGNWRTLLPLCTKGNVEELTAAANAMEKDGLQVQAVTYRLSDVSPAVYTSEELEHDLTCVGLLGLRIPLRQEISHTATITPLLRTILFSNEPAASAAATATQAGLTDAPCVATAETIASLTEEEWQTAVEKYNIYCGLTSAQKLRVVSLLQSQGHIVAVTGGHSDDIQLLTEADISFVRNSTATDTAKNAADILLIDDSYVSAVAAIQEGKRLNRQHLYAIIYWILCAVVMAGIGVSALFGWTILHRQAILLMGMHLLLMDMLPPVLVLMSENFAKKN